jgi:hypothetical protein
MNVATRVIDIVATALLTTACGSGSGSATTPTPAPAPAPSAATSALTVTFSENPVPFRSTGCNGSVPQGWYTTARIQETAGLAFTPGTLTQKVDGTVAAFLTESFASRFGACNGAAFTPGIIAANGAVCGVVGVCTGDTYRTYQLEVTGTDANGRPITIASPVLQLTARTGTP